MINAACAESDTAWMRSQLEPAGIELIDLKGSGTLLALQGPDAAQHLEALAGCSLAGLPRFGHRELTLPGIGEAFVGRTGYTGEDGFELLLSAEAGQRFWRTCLERGVKPCGLGARDTLRTEMGYPLHGQDISPSITPVEAGMSWAIGWDKPTFGGREALVRQRESGPARRLRALRATQRAVPRSHMDVLSSEGATVGEVTSGTFSPTLKEGIALALVDASVSIDDEVVVDVRGRHVPFAVVKAPFVASNVRADD
mgnify:CR=1 FL=1